MTLQTSIEAARAVLRDNPATITFILTCNCGWDTRESPAWVEHCIRRHFSYADAKPTEHVSVVALDKRP